MKVIAVRVIRGTVDVPDQRALNERRHLNPYLFGARSFAHGYSRRYRVGETLELSEGEAKRLAALGVVEILPVS